MSRVGYDWRILAHKRNSRRFSTESINIQHSDNDNIDFDELVINGVLHIEKMNSRSYWAQIGDARLSIWVDNKGNTHVGIERGEYGDGTIRGWTIVDGHISHNVKKGRVR